MYHLINTERNIKHGICGYLWQKSAGGYDYEVEIMTLDGELMHIQQHSVSVERALQILQSDMLLVAQAYDRKYSAVLEDFG